MATTHWLIMILRLIFGLIASTANAATPLPDIVSINCGGRGNHTDASTSFSWQPDISYISTGTASSISTRQYNKVPLPKELETVRFFPASSSPRKNCYLFPTVEGTTYLIRAGFLCNKYDGFTTTAKTAFNMSLGNTFWNTVSCPDSNLGHPQYFEAITSQSKSSSLTFCLIRLEKGLAPFINSLEVRQIPKGAYNPQDYSVYVRDVHLFLVNRVNFGEREVTYRFPDDMWDRRWVPYVQVFPDMGKLRNLSAPSTSIRVDKAHNAPPQKVMSTAIESPTISYTFKLPPASLYIYSIQYFAEIASNLTSSDMRIMEGHASKRVVNGDGFFSIVVNLTDKVPPLSTFDLPVAAFAPSLGSNSERYVPELNVTFFRTSNSTLDALVNAAELFVLRPIVAGTKPSDRVAMLSIKMHLNLVHWSGDPCLPVPWDQVRCTEEEPPEVSEIRLLGRNLTGSIPDALGNLSSLSTLDLSGNHFTGPVPSTFSSLTSLMYLNLSNNNLSGILPTGLLEGLQNLRTLDISNNKLRGSISEMLIKKLGKDNFKFFGNAGLGVCYQNGTGCAKNHSTMRRSLFLAACVSAGLLLTLFLLPVIYVTILYHSSTNGPFDRQYRRLQERLRGKGASAQPFSLCQVRKATGRFGKKIGQGGFGAVYYGRLTTGQEVAVKVLSIKSHQGNQEFLNEIELLSVVHHKYLVSLVGYCQAWRQKILIYEYLKGGDLHGRLHGDRAREQPLSWKERTCIIVEVAEGLKYLHHGCNPMVIHRDVKAMNILLTETKHAKVADFGLSRLFAMDAEDASHITTVVKGTTGYLDPEYYTSQKLTDKSDVYSFGVLMLEVITGRPPIDPKAFAEDVYILRKVRHAVKAGRIEELVDPNLGTDCNIGVFHHLVDLSLQCVEANGKNRPAMIEVVQNLRNIGLGSGKPHRKADVTTHLDHNKQVQFSGDDSSGPESALTLSSNNLTVR